MGAHSALVAGGRATYVLVSAVVIVFLVLFFIFLPLTAVKITKATRCGNGVCEESCFTCASDCPCASGKVCFNDLGTCGAVPDEAKAALERYGGGTFLDSWEEEEARTFHARSGGKDVLIKSGAIAEMKPL